MDVEVSESKAVCIVMKKGMKMANRRVHVQMRENVVQSFRFVNSVKYLGVNVGVNMNFREHIRELRYSARYSGKNATSVEERLGNEKTRSECGNEKAAYNCDYA